MDFENMSLEERSKWLGRKACCDQDYGGSHYHCGRCDKSSNMMGHLTNLCKVTKGRTLSHMCCPDNCELDNVEEIQEELAFWQGLEKERDGDYSRVIDDIQKKLHYARSRLED